MQPREPSRSQRSAGKMKTSAMRICVPPIGWSILPLTRSGMTATRPFERKRSQTSTTTIPGVRLRPADIDKMVAQKRPPPQPIASTARLVGLLRYHDPVEISPATRDPIPPAEYANWIAPDHAIDQLRPIHPDTIREAIQARVLAGSLKAAAQTVVEITTGGGRQADTYCLLEAGDWINSAGDPFWAFGDVTVPPKPRRESGLQQLRIPGNGPTRVFQGVRLDPAGLGQLRAQIRPPPQNSSAPLITPLNPVAPARPAPPAPPRSIASLPNAMPPSEARNQLATAYDTLAKRSAPNRRVPQKPKAPVTHDEFMAWFSTLAPIEQAQGYRLLWARANRAFRPRKGIPRKWAEELARGRNRGRTRKS